jgi:hypothetical protein
MDAIDLAALLGILPGITHNGVQWIGKEWRPATTEGGG